MSTVWKTGRRQHSVAFRVSQPEWVELRKFAEKSGTTVSRLANEVLRQSAGLEEPKRDRRRPGARREEVAAISMKQRMVAFKVSEPEWKALKALAFNKGMTVPDLAKQELFRSTGLA